MYISLWENSRGHPDNVSFMQFSTKIDGFEQKDSQGFENSYNSYKQYPLEKFFIFTIYQNYTLALTFGALTVPKLWAIHLFINTNCTGLFCTMIILGGGGGGSSEAPFRSRPLAAKFGTRLKNCAERNTSVLFLSKTAHFICYDNLCKLYAF